MLFKLAIRNVLRNKRRSLLTVILMALSFGLISISLGMVEGTYGDIINLFTSQNTGHVQISSKEYAKNPSLFSTIKNYHSIIQQLKDQPEIKYTFPRIKSGALAFAQQKSIGVEVVGIDSNIEQQATFYQNRILKGSPLLNSNDYLVLVGKKVAKILSLSLDDEIVLISQGADGSIANDIFKVQGVIGSENDGIDDFRIYMSLATAAEYYSLSNRVHTLTLLLKDFHLSNTFSKNIQLDQNLIARPWQVIESDFYKAMEQDKEGNNISLIILMIIVGVTVLNTILMSTLERTREFGVLKAIGTLPSIIFNLILIEGLVLASIGALLGCVFGYIGNLYLLKYGIQLSEPVSFAGMLFTEYRSNIVPSIFITPLIILFATTFIASLYPAVKAAKIEVADALRNF